MSDVHAAMILAAGLGTRLRPLTDEVAKPMVPVGDRPAIAHVLARLRLFAPRVVVANVHHRPEDLAAWAEGEGIAVSHEPTLLGTAGGLAKAAGALGSGSVLVWNGDILSTLDPRRVTEHHAARDAEATLAFVPAAAGEGNIGLDRNGRVVRLRSVAFAALGDEVTGGHFIGIHVVGPHLRAGLPREGCLVGDVYLPALANGARLDGIAVTDPFRDVGDVASYVAANRAWLAERGATWWSSPDADVGDVSIEGSIIGAGAVVRAACTRSIVWPGARVDAPTDRAIVTPHRRVEAP